MENISQDLYSIFKKLGIQGLVVAMDSDSLNYPFSGRQMLVSHDRICQHVELRAKTLHDFIATAQKFYNAMHQTEVQP